MSRLKRLADLLDRDDWGDIPSDWFTIAAQIQKGTVKPEEWSQEDYQGAQDLLAVWKRSNKLYRPEDEWEDF